MNKFLSLLSTSLFFTGCLNSGSGGGFTTDSSPTNPTPALTLMNHLDEGLLWKSDCVVQGNISMIFYLSKSNGKILHEADFLNNTTCSFDGDDWFQAIKKTYSFNSDSGSLVTGIKESNEYYLINETYKDQANQSNFCGISTWVTDQWFETSNSSCDTTGLNSPISIGYQLLGNGSVNFNGTIFNR